MTSLGPQRQWPHSVYALPSPCGRVDALAGQVAPYVGKDAPFLLHVLPAKVCRHKQLLPVTAYIMYSIKTRTGSRIRITAARPSTKLYCRKNPGGRLSSPLLSAPRDALMPGCVLPRAAMTAAQACSCSATALRMLLMESRTPWTKRVRPSRRTCGRCESATSGLSQCCSQYTGTTSALPNLGTVDEILVACALQRFVARPFQ